MSQAGSLNGSGGGGGSSGAMTLIKTQTATNQTTLNFTMGITPTYNTYFLLSNAITDPTSTGASLIASLSVNGGATYITTGYFQGNSGLSLLFLDGGAAQGSLAGYLFNMTSGVGLVSTAILSVRSGVSAGGGGDNYTVAGIVVNAIQIATEDGTPFSGTFSLYGITQ